MPQITCLPDNQFIEVEKSETILEALLTNEIPHTHVCGGNAYCSTCRIMILDGIQHCSTPTSAEKILAKKLDFPVHVRLACQTKVSGDVAIRRMVLDNDDIDIVEGQLSKDSIGNEKTVAILFAAIRGATNFDEVNFPYDIVYIMSRYFHGINKVISQYGGVTNNYMGGWVMAVFGIDNYEAIAERAVWAGLEIQEFVKELNARLQQLSYSPLKVNIGIHYGSVVLVSVDPSKPEVVTPLGDAVNFVSRIENMNKKLGSELLISEAVYDRVKEKAKINRSYSMDLSGKDGGHYKVVYELVGMNGDAPSKVVKMENNMPIKNRIFSFVQKFAGSWGRSK
ncbi:adenylate/guanylate cyclase domain-containing protein [Pseudanabaena sp. PCC 6802]|uniref:adenylate/guanylate cyclase domain-containing protein n=1 Tax=Pseudanabaena sp. PCC 6802 TaxID=118173 RepID=UPI00034C2D2A|nr:adenylate/guanylate cyclase domain-containing protein [Pseudanabaena sp. PCC 6802]